MFVAWTKRLTWCIANQNAPRSAIIDGHNSLLKALQGKALDSYGRKVAAANHVGKFWMRYTYTLRRI